MAATKQTQLKAGIHITVDMRKYMAAKKTLDKSMNAATLDALHQLGSFTMKDAKRSIGPKSKRDLPPRPPGKPPRNRWGTGFAAINNITFIVVHGEEKVIIGPQRHRGKKLQGMTVPYIQEFGAVVREKVQRVEIEEWESRKAKGRPPKKVKGNPEDKARQKHKLKGVRVEWVKSRYGKAISIVVPPRPYMRPAHTKHQAKMLQYLRRALSRKAPAGASASKRAA